MAECLEAIGAEIHMTPRSGFRTGAGSGRWRCCRRRQCRTWRGRGRSSRRRSRMSMTLKAERSAMPVIMPGSAMGRMNKRDIASFRRNSRATVPRQRRCREPTRRRLQVCDLHGEPERVPDVRPLPDDGEPLERVARRRKLIALLLGGEGIEKDQRQRHVEEQEPANCERGQRPGRPIFLERIKRSHPLGHPR